MNSMTTFADFTCTVVWHQGAKRPILTIMRRGVPYAISGEINRGAMYELSRWAGQLAESGAKDTYTNNPRLLPEEEAGNR